MAWIDAIVALLCLGIVTWTIRKINEMTLVTVLSADQLRRWIEQKEAEISKSSRVDTPHATEVMAEPTDSAYTEKAQVVSSGDDETLWKQEQIERGIVDDGTTTRNVCAAWDDEDERLYRREQRDVEKSKRLLDDAAARRGIRWSDRR